MKYFSGKSLLVVNESDRQGFDMLTDAIGKKNTTERVLCLANPPLIGWGGNKKSFVYYMSL